MDLMNFYLQLQRYCATNLEDLVTSLQLQTLDILEFWKNKSKTFFFPILFIMARDLLIPEVLTFASESIFNVGLDEYRSNFSLETLDYLMCLKN